MKCEVKSIYNIKKNVQIIKMPVEYAICVILCFIVALVTTTTTTPVQTTTPTPKPTPKPTTAPTCIDLPPSFFIPYKYCFKRHKTI